MQGSYLLANPSSWSAMFWNALPKAVFWPMFIVATLAAIIASQAMISAVFQIVKQAIAQGFFPRFHVYHTSRKVRGALQYVSTHPTPSPQARSEPERF